MRVALNGVNGVVSFAFELINAAEDVHDLKADSSTCAAFYLLPQDACKDLKCRRRSFWHSIKQLWATGTAMLLLFFLIAD